ncbi:hypothetical protein H6F88_18000 [Oculatella sp. FACHB-28]|uniref:hypothetical protein n=1 Tax=Oculatella sp. FACHB-28 TaxID=2692845 RepID=UPI001689166D|nr:hypothetical protein [Oculatella sp. FACHB-28]MBD2057889.1 hypothetical protein [Oculatella sp. FACHB-28]
MTNFNRSKIQRTAHDWLAIADEANDKSGSPTLVASAGVIGGLAFASLTASPLVAAVPICWGVWEAWKINGRKAKNDEAIAAGCIASILSNEAFHQFRQQAGDEAVYDQVSWAEDEGLPLSRDAQDFLNWYRQFKQQPQLPAAETAGELPAAVGANTRLNAVETTATPVDETMQAVEKIFDLPDESVEQQPQTSATLTVTAEPPATVRPAAVVTADLVEMMCRQLKSTIVAAPPRTGKGILVANAGRRLLKYRPDVEVWLVDPKDEPSEAHYWSFVDLDKRLHFDLRDFSIDVSRVEGLLEEFQQRFNASSAATKLLIVDEFVSLNKMLDSKIMGLLKSRLVAISSSGETGSDGKGRFTWIVTQSPNATDIGFGTKSLRSSFSSVLLFSTQTASIIDSAVGTGFCPKLETAARHKLLAPTGRGFYYSRGDRWAALPKYETEFPGGETSRLSHPFSYQQSDEYQKDQFDFNAEAIDLEALLSAFDDVIDEPESNAQPASQTDEQILIAWFEKHPDQFYTKRQIVQMKVKVSQPERLEEQLTKLVKDGWLEVEETAQTTKFKWLPD